jgi:DNA-binding beta-propeller fold protein YncE
MALFAIMLAIGLGALAPPAEAAPFAYVITGFPASVAVIDTATNTVVNGFGVGEGQDLQMPGRVAVAPDGKHIYATSRASNDVFDGTPYRVRRGQQHRGGHGRFRV